MEPIYSLISINSLPKNKWDALLITSINIICTIYIYIVDFLGYNNAEKSWRNCYFVICGTSPRILGNCHDNAWMDGLSLQNSEIAHPNIVISMISYDDEKHMLWINANYKMSNKNVNHEKNKSIEI